MAGDEVPTCRACPKCGTTAAKKIGSQKLVSASGDRLCLKCGTRYTPPTPTWIKLSLLLMGLVFAGPTVPMTIAIIARKLSGGVEVVEHGDAWIQTPSSWTVLICAAITAVFGLLCLWQGVRMWMEKPVEPPKPTARSSGSV